MKISPKTCFTTCLLSQAIAAIDISTSEPTCDTSGWTQSGPIKWPAEGTTFENMIITAPPNTDFAFRLSKDNITLRNVIIYHPANGMGLYGWSPKNLTLENVQIIAYGNEWGAQPCPSRSPMNGYRCNNIEIRKAENLVITNVEVEGGSKGIAVIDSPGALLKKVVARNMRGPFPAGACFQIQSSDDTILTDFHCKNDIEIAFPEDAISIYRSSGVIVSNGVVDGSNSPTGMGVMFEGSQHGVSNGVLIDVEAINCKGCFSAFPMDGLYQRNLTCASPICPSDNSPRGGNPMTNLWTAGANKKTNVYSSDIWVQDSFYYDPCDFSEMRLKWEYEEGMFSNFEVTELEEFTPRTPPQTDFSWDASCWMPTTDCSEFLQEPLGRPDVERTAVLDPTKNMYETPVGSCWGNESWLD